MNAYAIAVVGYSFCQRLLTVFYLFLFKHELNKKINKYEIVIVYRKK